MPNSQFHTAISGPRFGRYLLACGTQDRALALYKANIGLSQEMWGVIGVFEVILRNSVDRYMLANKGLTWLEDAVADGGYLDITPGCEDSYHSVQDAIHKLGHNYTHDRLIAKFTFGFWTYQFATKEFAAAGSILLNIFPNRPFGTRQKDVFQQLIKINDIRNRIAHHEPLCFEGGIISIAKVKRRYDLIIELLQWLGCNPTEILDGIDGVAIEIEKVNAI